MKQEILDAIKKDFAERKERQKELKKKQRRKTELEQTKLVKEYLELKKELRNVHFLKDTLNETETDILMKAFRTHAHLIEQSRWNEKEDSEDIYVYLGTYMYNSTCDIVHGSTDYIVSRDCKDADYRQYRHLEDYWDTKDIPIAKCEEFEKTHKVIFLKGLMSEIKYYEMQREFIQLAVKYGQEEAYRKILKKYQ